MLECAKRWQHFLDPTLDRSEWTAEEVRQLYTDLNAEHHADIYGISERASTPRSAATWPSLAGYP